jgi:tetratricopeptide (TPR) repeat protein
VTRYLALLLVAMSASAADEPLFEARSEFDARAGLHADLPTRATVHLRGRAAIETHRGLSALPPAAVEQALRRYAETEFGMVSVSRVEQHYDEASGTETIALVGATRVNWAPYRLIIASTRLGSDADFSTETGTNAVIPVLVPHPTFRRIVVEFRLPAGMSFIKSGGDHDVTLAGVRYMRRAKLENSVFVAEAEIQSQLGQVSLAEARAAQKALNDLYQDGLELAAEDYRETDADLAALRALTFSAADEFIWRGQILENSRDFDGAVADYSAAYALEPDHSTRTDRGFAYYGKQDYKSARADFEAVLAEQPSNARALSGLGAIQSIEGQYTEAIASLGAAQMRVPGDPFTLTNRGWAYEKNGEDDKALADADAVLRQDPGSLDMHELRARVHYRRGNREASLREADTILQLGANDPTALYSASYLYRLNDQRAEAMSAMDLLIARLPSAYNYHLRSMLHDPADIARIMADLAAALRLDSGYEPAILARAKLLSEAGDHAAAISIYDRQLATGLDAHRKSALMTLRGIVHHWNGQAALARKDFAGALAGKPGAGAHTTFCWYLALANVELSRALTACEWAVKMSPSTAAYLETKGFALLQLGRYDQAVAAFDAALAVKPQQAQSWYLRGQAKNRRCDCADGDPDIGAAKKIDPGIEFRYDVVPRH